MPRYYFHVHGGRTELDTEGTELSSVAAARVMAVQLAGAILKDEACLKKYGETWRLEVSDETGSGVCRVEVSVSDPTVDQ